MFTFLNSTVFKTVVYRATYLVPHTLYQMVENKTWKYLIFEATDVPFELKIFFFSVKPTSSLTAHSTLEANQQMQVLLPVVHVTHVYSYT